MQKLDHEEDLNQQDIELVTTATKGQPVISDEEKTILEKLGEPVEKEAEDNGNARREDEDENDEPTPTDGSFLSRGEKRLLQKVLGQEETFDDELISQRLEKLYNLKNYPFNALKVVPKPDGGTSS